MNIGIVGLGLIGGSLGLDLRSSGHHVVGVSRQGKTCDTAVALGAVDQASCDLTALASADVVFVCTPIAAIAPTVATLSAILSQDAVITDVGSVKSEIVAAATQCWPNFVGGHPMAGKSEAGIDVAEIQLFKGRPYVLTPLAQTPLTAIAVVRDLVQSLHANLYECSPEIHDRAVAWISHLPVMVSASLIQACMTESDPVVRTQSLQFASSGFRDTSRVGGGNPELGVMMAQYNRSALLHALKGYRNQLDQVTALVEQENWPGLEHLLSQTHTARTQFNGLS